MVLWGLNGALRPGFPDDDQDLADVLRALDEQAQWEGFAFSGWMGFEDPRIVRFLEQHPARSS